MKNSIYIDWVVEVDNENISDLNCFTTEINTDNFEDWNELSEDDKQTIINQAVAEDFNSRAGYLQIGIRG